MYSGAIWRFGDSASKKVTARGSYGDTSGRHINPIQLQISVSR